MRYPHIWQAVASTPWAILPEKLDVILAVLAARESGVLWSTEEIRARVGASVPATEPPSGGSLAIVPIRGIISHRVGTMEDSSGGTSAERIAGLVQQAAADRTVRAIVLDVDSPGGTITGVPEAAAAVRAAREDKPVVAVANGALASAAYWIASQASEIVAIPSVFDRVIGSLGVFAVHEDHRKQLEQDGVAVTILRSVPQKAEGNPVEALSEDTRAAMQASIDAAHEAFMADVAVGRRVSRETIDARYGQGRAFAAAEALSLGLIDRIETMPAVLQRVARTLTDTTRAKAYR